MTPIGTTFITSALSSAFDALGSWFSSRIEDKRAEKQHKRTKELMSLQNDYQVAQWNRENEYNDPSAVAERFREAGINPRAVFGSGPGGAGIAGSLSSAPSASSHSPLGSNHFAGLGSGMLRSLNETLLNEQQRSNMVAEEEKTREQTTGYRVENQFKEQQILLDLQDKRSDILVKLTKSDLNKSLKDRYEKDLEYINQQIKESEQRIENLKQENKESLQRIDESKKRIDKYESDIALNEALVELNNNKVENVKMDTALKDAQKGHYGKLIEQINHEIKLIAQKIYLTKEQEREITNRIARDWAKYGATVAKMTSEEVRRWIFGWIPGTNNSASTTFEPDEPFIFAD